MTPHERFQAVTHFRPFDRLPVIEWAMWWDQTIARWHTEGLPPEMTDRYAITRHFGLDVYYQDWLSVRKPGCPRAPSHGAPLMPATLEGYERLRPHLFPDEALNRARWSGWAAEQQRGDAVLWLTLDGFFWFARTLLGIQPHLYAFYDAPELLHRINADLAEWQLRMIEQVCAVCAPDFITFAEDLSYNNGPMLSRALFEEFVTPYYARVVPLLKRRGVLVVVDSDGDITMPAPWFEAAGVEGILPLERQAGVDIARLRAAHPRLCFIGHFDKMTMTRGEDAMRAEFERLLPTARQGGFLISCDHQTPPGVSYQAYQCYLALFREYAQRAGASG
ncbi:MAG: hypothetical protein K8T26_05000 [Lentisphaerae bacterium]|nr:hypothetical protein [Lentisphaerota bacterium]